MVGAWAAATIGALLGALILYALGALVGYERLDELAGKRWFIVVSQSDLARGERFFERHGSAVVLLGRCVPLVRSAVSVPAGVARMPLGRFALFTAIGSGVWNAIFITAGWQLGERWDEVEAFVGPLSYVVVALLAVALAVLVVRKVRKVRGGRRAVAASRPQDGG
ncbi:hypothetical protein BH24ACT3_BH24ACT3_05420 [soil metagenome]